MEWRAMRIMMTRIRQTEQCGLRPSRRRNRVNRALQGIGEAM